MWVCATGARHSKSLERRSQRTACLQGEAKKPIQPQMPHFRGHRQNMAPLPAAWMAQQQATPASIGLLMVRPHCLIQGSHTDGQRHNAEPGGGGGVAGTLFRFFNPAVLSAAFSAFSSRFSSSLSAASSSAVYSATTLGAPAVSGAVRNFFRSARGPAHQLAVLVRMRIKNCTHGHNNYCPINQPCTVHAPATALARRVCTLVPFIVLCRRV